jgi:hypothetical protein
VVERGGFEPPKATPADLQSAPFDRSGTSPKNSYREASEGNRTPDPLITNQLLCLLSYAGLKLNFIELTKYFKYINKNILRSQPFLLSPPLHPAATQPASSPLSAHLSQSNLHGLDIPPKMGYKESQRAISSGG